VTGSRAGDRCFPRSSINLIMPRLLLASIAFLFSLSAGAAGPQIEMKTSLGTIVIELDAEKAPATVANFVQYVKDRHYDGTVFHRVIPGFMIQGGGFDADFKQKPTRAPIKNEAANGLKNDVGTIAMARTADPHSATAQFFINVADNASLNFRFPTPEGYGYTVFGKVTKGMDVVQRIVRVQTGPGPAPHRDVPVKPVVIESARVIEAKPASGK
jgi:peptidyl-prolyl cis-trans isomerase A (cyclophilin A)/peptidyl-prolyl cis-trans isomerase B (cyclophilin B)